MPYTIGIVHYNYNQTYHPLWHTFTELDQHLIMYYKFHSLWSHSLHFCPGMQKLGAVPLNTRPVLAWVHCLLILSYSLPKYVRARTAELVWAVEMRKLGYFIAGWYNFSLPDSIHASPGTHPASWVKQLGHKLTTHFHLVWWLRIHGVLTPFPLCLHILVFN